MLFERGAIAAEDLEVARRRQSQSGYGYCRPQASDSRRRSRAPEPIIVTESAGLGTIVEQNVAMGQKSGSALSMTALSRARFQTLPGCSIQTHAAQKSESCRVVAIGGCAPECL